MHNAFEAELLSFGFQLFSNDLKQSASFNTLAVERFMARYDASHLDGPSCAKNRLQATSTIMKRRSCRAGPQSVLMPVAIRLAAVSQHSPPNAQAAGPNQDGTTQTATKNAMVSAPSVSPPR